MEHIDILERDSAEAGQTVTLSVRGDWETRRFRRTFNVRVESLEATIDDWDFETFWDALARYQTTR